MTTEGPAELPAWERSGPVGRAVELAGLLAASPLLLVHLVRLRPLEGASAAPDLIVVALALLCADFISGMVHWAADTWGSDTCPVVGPRLLRPFRLHHLNPGDLLRRDFIECNGDVAVLAVASLMLTFFVPIGSDAGRLGSLFLVALAAWVLPTNQVHQWAHQAEPTRVIRWAQDLGLILSRSRHAVHHVAPFDRQYCILTGWCNRPLGMVGFFPALEGAIGAVTGLVPRADEETSQLRPTGAGAERA
jgi:ubiquitin-conjugating enzyme E2 variant